MSTRGHPKSAFRDIDKKRKCRCGGAADTGWSLTLSDPALMRTCSVPLCGSCGPVLFDKLAGEGWLTMPLLGETILAAKTELAEKEIVKPCEHCGISGGAKQVNLLGLYVCVDTAGCAERIAAAAECRCRRSDRREPHSCPYKTSRDFHDETHTPEWSDTSNGEFNRRLPAGEVCTCCEMCEQLCADRIT